MTMTLDDALTQLMKAWAYDLHGDSVYVAHGNVAWLRRELDKRGLGYVRVYQRLV